MSEFRFFVGVTFRVSFDHIVVWSACEVVCCSSRVLCLELCTYWFRFIFIGFLFLGCRLLEIAILLSLFAILMTIKRIIILFKVTIIQEGVLSLKFYPFWLCALFFRRGIKDSQLTNNVRDRWFFDNILISSYPLALFLVDSGVTKLREEECMTVQATRASLVPLNVIFLVLVSMAFVLVVEVVTHEELECSFACQKKSYGKR